MAPHFFHYLETSREKGQKFSGRGEPSLAPGGEWEGSGWWDTLGKGMEGNEAGVNAVT